MHKCMDVPCMKGLRSEICSFVSIVFGARFLADIILRMAVELPNQSTITYLIHS
jgi:hypothetical protein